MLYKINNLKFVKNKLRNKNIKVKILFLKISNFFIY